jgi:hypothetical protein
MLEPNKQRNFQVEVEWYQLAQEKLFCKSITNLKHKEYHPVS